MRRRVGWLAAAFAASAAIGGTVYVATGRRHATDGLWGDAVTSDTPTPLPAADRVASPASPTADDFAGAESCASCHAPQFAAWQRSTHGRAGGAATPDRVIAPFDGRPIRMRDATVIPSVTNGTYTFTVHRDGEPDVTLRVDAVIGGGHMRGGGTQAFVTRWTDGTYRIVPFDFSRQAAAWFCNTGTRTGRGWVPITADLPLAACGDWPPARVLGDEPRFANCQSCHGSRIELTLDTVARAWRTRFASLAIECESCHGPARAHVIAARAGSSRAGAGALPALATLGKQASVEVCAACHAMKSQLTGGPGATGTLAARYSTRLAQLGDSIYHPDGRTRTFAYQEGHLWSDCYVSGGITCTSCHDPHTQTYRDATGRPLAGPDDDGQCTACHASKGTRVASHTKHEVSSPGSRCVACHMPYVQQPEVGARIPYGRSDHTIAIPRPAFDASLGVRSACATCHAGRSPAALDADVRRLWGELKPHASPVAALARAHTITEPGEAARALLDTTTAHTAAQFAGLAEFVERFLAPDMPSLAPDAIERLVALTRAADVDVRALALAALHYAGGTRPGVRRLLAERLRAARSDDRPLRARWATALGTLGDGLSARGDPRGASRAYALALEVQPDEGRLHARLGLMLVAAGEPAAAMERYRRALVLDPRQPLTLVNLGVALESAGDAAGATAAYRRALALDAYEPLALANLGNVFLRAGDPASAIPLYRQSLTVDPSLASVHFSLAQASGQRGDVAGALAELRRGLAFDSSDAQVRELARNLADRLRGTPQP